MPPGAGDGSRLDTGRQDVTRIHVRKARRNSVCTLCRGPVMVGQQISDGSGHGWAHVECFINQRNGDQAVQDQEQLKPQVYYSYGEVGHDPPVHMVAGSWIGPKEVKRAQARNESLCGKKLARFRGRPSDPDLLCGSCRRIAAGDSVADAISAQMKLPDSINEQDYEVRFVPLGELCVDRSIDLQRAEQSAWSKNIAQRFDWAKFNRRPPIVSIRDDGTKHVIDGQHGISGARLAGYGPDTLVRCHAYHGLTVQQEAEMFDELNTQRKSVKPIDTFRIRVTANHPGQVAVKALLNSHGWQIGSAGKAGNFAAVTTLLRIYNGKNGPEVCQKILRCVTDAWGYDSEGVHQTVIKVLALFWQKYPEADLARLSHVLKREPELQPHRIHGWTHEQAWQDVAVVRLRERYNNRLDQSRRLEP